MAEACDESVTAVVKLKVPAAVGVPETMPLLANVTPPGSTPVETLQAYPLPVPPVAVSVAEYGAVAVPAKRDVVVTAKGVEVEEAEEPAPQPCRGQSANTQCSAIRHLLVRMDRQGLRRTWASRKRGFFISCSVRTGTPSKRLLYNRGLI